MSVRKAVCPTLILALALLSCNSHVLDTALLVQAMRASADTKTDVKLHTSITTWFYAIPNWSNEKFVAEYEFALLTVKSEKKSSLDMNLGALVAAILKAHPQGKARLERDWVEILGLFKVIPNAGQSPFIELLEAKAPEVIEEQQVLPLIAASGYCSEWNQLRLRALALTRSTSLQPMVVPLQQLVSDCTGYKAHACRNHVVWAVDALDKRQSLASGWTKVMDVLIEVHSAEAKEPLRKLIAKASTWPKSEEESRWWRESAQSSNAYRRDVALSGIR